MSSAAASPNTGSVVASRYKFHHRYKVHRCVPRESRVLVAPIRFEIGREFAARGPNCHSITADAQRRSRRRSTTSRVRCAWPGHWTAVDGCCSRRSPHPPTPSLPPRGSPVSCVALFRRMSRRGRGRDEAAGGDGRCAGGRRRASGRLIICHEACDGHLACVAAGQSLTNTHRV